MINIKDFDARLLKTDKKSYKNTGIYNIGYIKKKKINANASGYIKEKDLNALYLNIEHASGYIKEKGVNKSLIFDPTDEIKSY